MYIVEKEGDVKRMKKSKVTNYVCIALMGLLLILQFMPFWSYDGVRTSIQSMVWFPLEHEQLEMYFVNQLGDFWINDIVLMPVVILFASVGGIILHIIKPDAKWTFIFPVLCGIIGCWGYLVRPEFQLGTNWVLHLMVCILVLAGGIISLAVKCKEA